jgi:putative FmdB family regulatory protein
MPIYEYQPSGDQHCDHCLHGFEILRKSSEPELENCPQCGAPVVRRISAPSLAKPGPALDAANIEKHGFTQYKKAGKGIYEKTAGKGPDTITGD